MDRAEAVILWRPRAIADVEQAAWSYRDFGGSGVATRFVAELQRATTAIWQEPFAGSTRHGIELGMPGLRSWVLDGFPYLVFYFYLSYEATVEVLRVLHARRDVQSLLAE